VKSVVRVVLSFAWLFPLSQIEAAKKATSPKTACPAEIVRSAATLPFVKIWEGKALRQRDKRIADLNGILIWEMAEFCQKKKRLPIATELSRALKNYIDEEKDEKDDLIGQAQADLNNYFQMAQAPSSLEDLFRLSLKTLPLHFEPTLSAARKKLVDFYGKHLHFPNLDQLSAETKVEATYLSLLIGEPNAFVESAQQAHSGVIEAAKLRIVKAFMRAMQQKDTPDHLRTQQNTPSIQEVFAALIRNSQNAAVRADHLDQSFSEEDFAQLMGQPAKKRKGPQPLFASLVLFPEGIAELEKRARLENPAAFKNFRSDIVFDISRSENARDAIASSPGFLITSVTAGIPLEEEQYALMRWYAEKRGFPIIVLPTNQILEGLDPRLLETPNVHVVTNTIENASLKIWALPIMGKNMNPFASTDGRGQFKPGQTIFVGHPQLGHKIIPTGSNHIQETAEWSPGSLCQAIYPYRHAIQGRTSGIAKNFHRNSFLVVEKADSRAGLMGEGIRSFWHVRPVEYTDDRDFGGTAGFNDLGKRYSVSDLGANPKFTVTDYQPSALIVGDLHDWVADQRMLQNYRSVLERFPALRDVYIHDPIDGFSHNHHEDKRFGLLIQKFNRGELDFHKEMMGLVQTSNAFLSFRPNIRVKFPDSNHSYWGRQLLDRKTELQSIINGTFLAELAHARDVLRVSDPLEWVFHHRNAYIETLPPAIRHEVLEKSLLVNDPQRVQVIPFGVPDVIGPNHRPVHLNFHGHQGANGARGSAKSHATGSQNAVVGDSHQSVILGGLVNVGTSTTKRIVYNNGGYSAWNNSFALVYPDGTKQLITYSSLAGTYAQRSELGVLPPELFFGEDPLTVAPTDNELLPNAEVMDAHSMWLDMLRGSKGKK
jgi:hypothetical protein